MGVTAARRLGLDLRDVATVTTKTMLALGPAIRRLEAVY
jgi:hypothetical protein